MNVATKAHRTKSPSLHQLLKYFITLGTLKLFPSVYIPTDCEPVNFFL